jgi:hypothetical protein
MRAITLGNGRKDAAIVVESHKDGSLRLLVFTMNYPMRQRSVIEIEPEMADRFRAFMREAP